MPSRKRRNCFKGFRLWEPSVFFIFFEGACYEQIFCWIFCSRFCLRHHVSLRRCCRGEYVEFIPEYSMCCTDPREAHHQFRYYSHYGRCLLFVERGMTRGGGICPPLFSFLRLTRGLHFFQNVLDSSPKIQNFVRCVPD